MKQVYARTENGTATEVSVKEALAEVNTAMTDGKDRVRSMSSQYGRHDITYTDGRHVLLVLVQVQADKQASQDPQEWSGTHSRSQHLHRFGENGRARCSSRIRPLVWNGQNTKGVVLHTRAEIEGGAYAHLYTFCPRCQAKP